MSTPWASFCMTTYKRPGFLKKALSYIQAQTFMDFEVVISDNDPERSAEAVVQGMKDDRFLYFPNETNLGMVRSFNKSIERSKGNYIVMVTDDDPVYPHMLQTLYDLSVQYPGYGLYNGGHDTFFHGMLQAQISKARIGTNSSLANFELDAVHAFSAEQFPTAFLDGTIFPGGFLWSVGAVRRDIALSIGGFPDYDTPHLADCAFSLLSGAAGGCVFVNTELGYRAIHNENYSYSEANYEKIYTAPDGFYNWVKSRMPPALLTSAFEEQLRHYIGRDMSFYVISIKRMLAIQRIDSPVFESFRKRFFELPLLKKWKTKYNLNIHFPRTFELYLAFRNLFSSPFKNIPGK